MSYSFSENQWGEKYIEELNRNDFTGVKSAKFFDGAFEHDLTLENTLYLVIGSDSGLLLNYIIQQKLGRGSRIAVIEHDDVYPLVATEYRGLLQSDNDVKPDNINLLSLHKHSLWQSEVFDGSEKPWLHGGHIKTIESNAAAVDYAHIYMPIVQATKRFTRAKFAEVSGALNRTMFTDMQFRNCADNINPLKSSTTFGENKTAIVLGGSPSLDQHIEWVKEHRDKLFILAVSRIAGKLMNHELKPDLVVSVDPQELSYDYCKLGLLWTDVPLICNYHVCAKLLQQWQGSTYYIGKRLPWHGIDQMAGCIPSAGPTVSHAAAFIAIRLGFSQVLMTGVDLCFSATASTHSSDLPERMIQSMPSLCDARTETYSGRIAGTNFTLFQGIEPLNQIGKLANAIKPVLFNMSADAALCESIPYLHVKDVEIPDRKPDIAMHFDLQPRLNSMDELGQLETELKKTKHTFKKMQALCTDAKNCIKKMHSPDAAMHAQKQSSKLSKIRKQLEKEHSPLLAAIMHDNGFAFKKTSTPTEFEDMSTDELIAWGSHYYDLIDDGAEKMISLIDGVSQRIDIRREEQATEVNVRQLAKRWREDDTPGRILLWKRLKWQTIRAEDRAWAQRAVGKFRSTLNDSTTRLEENLVSRNKDIDNALKSLVFLSENNSLEELQAIESNFSDSLWPYCALKPFTAGLISVLGKDTNTALEKFQQSVDICSEQLNEQADSLNSMQRLIEECLVRMTNCYISIEDYKSSLTTLGMLCEMLPSYVLLYAKMLDLCGHKAFAVELLETYIQLYPTHKKASFVLSQIRPDETQEQSTETDPSYVKKISGAMEAIMGGNPEHTAKSG